MKYVIQVFCTGLGWVDSKHGGDTPAEAAAAEKALLTDDSAWVDPAAPRQTRMKPAHPYTVRVCAVGNLLCEFERPVFNLSLGQRATPAEASMALGLPRAATISEINAYRRVDTPHVFTDLNRPRLGRI